MSSIDTVFLAAIGAGYLVLMAIHEFVIQPFLKAYFAMSGSRGATRRQRKFEWACRHALSYFYAAGSFQSLRELSILMGVQFGSLLTALQVGAILLGVLFVFLAWYRWEHAWGN